MQTNSSEVEWLIATGTSTKVFIDYLSLNKYIVLIAGMKVMSSKVYYVKIKKIK